LTQLERFLNNPLRRQYYEEKWGIQQMDIEEVNYNLMYVVDDEKDITNILKMLGNICGLEVRAFNSAVEAANAISNGERPGLLMSDNSMPGMTGLELSIYIGEKSPNTVRILYSGSLSEQESLENIKSREIDGYIPKPCAAKEIADVFKNYRYVNHMSGNIR